ncbi:MAG TPA: biotin/lipoyl-containing protein [Thermoanaerobaculia bacterium]|nr:biotin/lipoyl-containing protein [Thermoanaerobaculia bacterium]
MKLVAVHDGSTIPVEVERAGSGYRICIGDRWMNVDMTPANAFVHSLRFEDGRQARLGHRREGNMHEISFGNRIVRVELHDPLAMKRKRREDQAGDSGHVEAIMPGRIVRLLVSEGDEVRKGTGLLILEAMKMENEIVAPCDGTISTIRVKQGETVEGGSLLIVIA